MSITADISRRLITDAELQAAFRGKSGKKLYTAHLDARDHLAVKFTLSADNKEEATRLAVEYAIRFLNFPDRFFTDIYFLGRAR